MSSRHLRNFTGDTSGRLPREHPDRIPRNYQDMRRPATRSVNPPFQPSPE